MNILFVLSVVALFPFYIYGQAATNKLSLKEAIDIGLKNNPEVHSAIFNIEAVKGKFLHGISIPMPEIGISYDYTPVSNSLSNFGERTIELKQSFEFPTIYFLKGNKLKNEEAIANQRLNQIERKVINKIKTDYYKVLVKQYQINFAEENLKISEDFFRKSEIRQNFGEGTNLEKLTAKVQYIEALSNIDVVKNELSTAFAELNCSLGFGVQGQDFAYVLTDSLNFVDHKISLEKSHSLFEEASPEIKIAQLNSAIAASEKSLAWASLLPNISLSYFKQSRDGNNSYYGASFGITVPLWFMFEQKGKIEEASAMESIFASELQKTTNEIGLKLKVALVEHENNLKRIRLSLSDILPQAEEVYRIAKKSFAVGEISYLEYLQAKQILTNSRNSYISALFNQYQSLFRIEEIIGRTIIDKQELEK